MPDTNALTSASPLQARLARVHLAYTCTQPIGELLAVDQPMDYWAEDFELAGYRLDAEEDYREPAQRLMEIARMLDDGGPLPEWMRDVAVEQASRFAEDVAKERSGVVDPLIARGAQYDINCLAGYGALLAPGEVSA